jgi:carbon storage regulator
MLVLSRGPGEEIIIGGNIIVTIVSVRGDRVRVGIKAPNDVTVDRLEVHARKGLKETYNQEATEERLREQLGSRPG